MDSCGAGPFHLRILKIELPLPMSASGWVDRKVDWLLSVCPGTQGCEIFVTLLPIPGYCRTTALERADRKVV